MARRRGESSSPGTECSLEAGSREMSEPWKGALGCVGVALLFLMTIGVLYWQVAERPEPAWLMKGQLSGLLWHSKKSALALRSVLGEQSFALIQPRHLPLSGHTLLTNRCWFNQSRLCSSWDGVSELQILLEPINQSLAECYRVEWTPRHCQVALKQPTGHAHRLRISVGEVFPWINRFPFWRLQKAADIVPKLEHNLRSLSNKLKQHQLGDGVLDLTEQHTQLLFAEEHSAPDSPGKTRIPNSRYPNLHQLRLCITLSPYISIDSNQFRTILQQGREHFWISLPATTHSPQVPFVMKWRGKFVVKLNLSNEEARDWFVAQAHRLHRRLEVKYITLEGGEGRPNIDWFQHHSGQFSSDEYITQFTLLAEELGNTTIISTATQTAHIPVFVRMAPRQSDWSYAGLKGLIPTVLHYSLLGYSFFIPDAVGGSLTKGFLADEELFIRWLQIVTFLPVMSFSTPPWVFGENWIVNVTQMCIQRHQSFVVPLIIKQAAELASLGHPVFRPLWWVSPDDPKTLTVDDEFLIGDEVLVAPVTAPGRVHRDIYLPGSSYQWKDVNTAQMCLKNELLKLFCKLYKSSCIKSHATS
ncbi:SITS-binding protein [Rhincodon typus]|uniref:SITS-binding protein n=1 Tax=Rhincodon typus TaxID=259920 RepID=UPI00202FCC8A|nr:SITS-binding protein [Rhincodon typus]